MNLATAGLVLGVGVPRIDRCREVERLVDGYRDLPLNNRQRDAIEQALASDITFIWGPPGTGKTEVVARIVEGCVRQGLRVLFLAPTHVAVDQAMERLCALLEREDGFEQGLVQRVGDIALPSLHRRFGAAISLDRIVERAAEELAQRSTQLSARLDAVRANIVLHDRLAATERRLEALTAGRDALERRAADADAAMSRSSEQAQAVQQERVRIGSSGLLFAQRKQRRIDDLEADIVALRRAAERARVDRDRVLAELPSSRLEQQSATEDLRGCRDLLTGVEALDRLRHMEQRLREDLARVEKSRREVDQRP